MITAKVAENRPPDVNKREKTQHKIYRGLIINDRRDLEYLPSLEPWNENPERLQYNERRGVENQATFPDEETPDLWGREPPSVDRRQI